MTWQPIETAPRDGTVILLAKEEQVVAGWWSDAKETQCSTGTPYPWCFMDDHTDFDEDASVEAGAGLIQPNGWQDNSNGPTHWQPLPAPPATTDDDAFLTRILAAAQASEPVTAEDVAQLRQLADWADAAPPAHWDGRMDRHETARAVAAARKRMAGGQHV